MKINERFEPDALQNGTNHLSGYRDLVPLLLRTPEFLEAWDEWVQNRIQLGKKYRWPVTELSFRKTLKKCEQWGVKRSIVAIDYSIEYGYRGLFEPHQSEQPEPETYKPGSSFRGRGG